MNRESTEGAARSDATAPAKRLGVGAFMLLALAVTGCDHITKAAANTRLGGGAHRDIIPGVLQLHRAANSDTAFSLLGKLVPAPTLTVLLTVMQVTGTLAIGVAVGVFWRGTTALQRAAGALLLGGALGNAIDRAAHGYVVDFIYVRFWPIFNVADIALTVGAGLLIVASRPQPSA